MVDLSEFDEANVGPGVIPGRKVDVFLESLPDDRREAATAALSDLKYGVYLIERVFRKWTAEGSASNPPGHVAIEKWREREHIT